jgi:hypothetical protein
MSFVIESPQMADIDELLKLYFLIYGDDYPISYGCEPDAMTTAIQSDDYRWLIARDKAQGVILGSLIFELDRPNKVAKATALVVHPDHRQEGIACELVSRGDELISAKDGMVNSIYTTTRTGSIGPQLVFLHKGYLPLGVFPNAHKLRVRETTTLCAKFRDGVFERRVKPPRIPQQLVPLYEIVKEHLPALEVPGTASVPVRIPEYPPCCELAFESIFAPAYVHRRFLTLMEESTQFYPFHLPNLLLAGTSGDLEMFAYLNKGDGYCTLIGCNRPAFMIEDCFPVLLDEIRAQGGSYVEVLLRADRFESVQTLLKAQFLPSSLYPGMREIKGKTYDYVTMTRSMEPLDFGGMTIDQVFKPYVDQYVARWTETHLDTLEVVDDLT